MDFNDYVRDFILGEWLGRKILIIIYVQHIVYGRSGLMLLLLKHIIYWIAILELLVKNIYPKMLVSLNMIPLMKIDIFFSSSGKNIYISINDNKYNVLDTKKYIF